jgi:hypothetical protein
MKKLTLALLLASLTACAGMREGDDTFTAHAEAFNLVGFQIPHDDYEAALELVPEGAEVVTIRSTPADWSSLSGILNRLLGVSYTEISGTK